MTHERFHISPEDARRKLQAYFDGELPENECRDLEDQLEHDDALRAELNALKALRRAIKSAPQPAASEALRRRILDRARASASVPSQPPRAGGGQASRIEEAPASQKRSGWRQSRWLGAAAILIVVVAAGYVANKSFLFFDPQPFGNNVASGISEYIQIHDTGYFKPQFGILESSDRQEIEDWFAQNADFAPPVPDLGQAATSRQAYFCTVRDSKVAIVRLLIGAVDASLFMHPSDPVIDPYLIDREAGRPDDLPVENGYGVMAWRENGFDYLLVVHESQIDRALDTIY